jgi:predicted nucleic acid-binding protein
MIVVADTSPLNYLILIEAIDVLPKLYGRIVIPRAVHEELARERTPANVRQWIERPPAWLEVRTPLIQADAELAKLDRGESEAIALAEELAANQIIVQLIVDELSGRRVAERRSLPVIGTIGVLREAAEMGLLDLRQAFDRLQQTSFHVSPMLLANLLRESSQG